MNEVASRLSAEDEAANSSHQYMAGVTPDSAHAAQLASFIGLLAKWNRVYNLTSVRDPNAMWERHISDCLQCVEAVRKHPSVGEPPLRLLDVGSGGGLPGVVIAIMLPHVEVTCIDAVAKKAAFVQQVATSLHLPNLRSRHGRVEDLDGSFDLITSRAFASLGRTVELSRRALAPGGAWLAMKGVTPTDELAEIDPAKYEFHVEQLPGLQNQDSRCLVWIKPQQLAHAS